MSDQSKNKQQGCSTAYRGAVQHTGAVEDDNNALHTVL